MVNRVQEEVRGKVNREVSGGEERQMQLGSGGDKRQLNKVQEEV
jgi:hypothetical protein